MILGWKKTLRSVVGCSCPQRGCASFIKTEPNALDMGLFLVTIKHSNDGRSAYVYLDRDGVKDLRRDLKHLMQETK